MDPTRKTTEMVDRKALAEAYDAYVHGTEVGRLAARLDVYPAELQAKFDEMTAERQAKLDEMTAERKRRSESPRPNVVERMQAALFAELDRLDSVDRADADALRLEIERSKAVEGIARATVENVGVALEAVRLKAQYSQEATVTLPKLLEE